MTETPRLFQLLPGSPAPVPGAKVLAAGVMWADDTITVRWLGDPRTQNWESWSEADIDLTTVTVVWLRQDTYSDLSSVDGTPGSVPKS